MNLKLRYLSPRVQEALIFASQAHKGQVRRYSGEPYIHHCMNVGAVLLELDQSENTVIAGLLHDCVEDTHVSLMDIDLEFGGTIAELVQACTAPIIPGANRAKRKQAFLEQLKKAPVEVKTIKLADLIDNVPSIVLNDIGFAEVYVPENRALLEEALCDGNLVLVKIAHDILNLSEEIVHLNERLDVDYED